MIFLTQFDANFRDDHPWTPLRGALTVAYARDSERYNFDRKFATPESDAETPAEPVERQADRHTMQIRLIRSQTSAPRVRPSD